MTWLCFVLAFGGSYLHSQLLFSLALVAIFGIILIFEWPRLVPARGLKAFLLSLFYPGLPMLAVLVLLHGFYPQDFYLPLYSFLIASGADTAGYLVGKSLGFHKICPSISPGKSWEGFLGSFIGVLGLNVVIVPILRTAPFPSLTTSWAWLVVLSVVLTSSAFLGGTFVSLLKRAKGLKDTGNILPGHGGFLDRFDSIFAVVLVVWVMVYTSHMARKVEVAGSRDLSTVEEEKIVAGEAVSQMGEREV